MGIPVHQPHRQFPTGDLGDGKRLCQGGKLDTGKLNVSVAPPTLVGAWSMALGLRRRIIIL